MKKRRFFTLILVSFSCEKNIDNTNTFTASTISLGYLGGYYYFPSASAYAVTSWGHTHKYSNNSSDADNDDKNKFPGLSTSIFYDGVFRSY